MYIDKNISDPKLAPESLGAPGFPADAPIVISSARGYQYQLEGHLDDIR